MKTRLIVHLTLVCMPFFLVAQSNGYNPQALEKAQETISAFKAKDTKFDTYFADAYGYAIFPSVAKGASGIGGAHGVGTAFELGSAIGKAKITQLTFGLQFGGQAYSQVIFFETEADFRRFTENRLEFAGQASVVAVTAGAGANLAYNDGVAIFTLAKAGLMYEASLGGQKLKFKPYKAAN